MLPPAVLLAGFPNFPHNRHFPELHPLADIMLAYGVMSLITFALFGWDKRAAQRGHWRLRENTLHAFELLGGFPGAILAQRVFRHKSYKRSYRVVLGAIVALHTIAWSWWLWSRT